MNILGLSCFYHDAAACLVQDGRLVAAASEERFTRKKHDAEFPKHAIEHVLRAGNITAKDLDYVGFYDKPIPKFDRILETYFSVAPRGLRSFMKAMPAWLKSKLWMRSLIEKALDYQGPILFTEHHESHAASAFFCSPYDEAAILTTDGVGEWATASWGAGKGNRLSLRAEIHFPHSLGLLYSAFTYYLGFKVNSAEYKVMGAAPYGEPKYYDLIMRELLDVKDDGSFRLNMDYFAFLSELVMVDEKFFDLFGGPPRQPETRLEQRHFDVAASVQKATEEVVLRMARHVHKETGLNKLCMAGGVALNCVTNGRIVKETPFRDLFVQPAAGDAGGAVGVALFVWYSYLDHPRGEPLRHVFLGPRFSVEEIKKFLDSAGAAYEELARDSHLARRVAQLVAEKNVVGWFQGRMEFGPRALGNRSILADARFPEMKDTVNLKIKFREGFRPFAPTVLAERAPEYFDLHCKSPYMLLTAPVREGKRVIPAVTHVDFSARLQTISREQNPLYYDLIKEYENLTGVPVIINTSFNVRGEPIVCTPKDAYLCFMRTHMDHLVLGPYLLDKKKQPPLRDDVDWRREFELD
jgi:carbamoyltransferase